MSYFLASYMLTLCECNHADCAIVSLFLNILYVWSTPMGPKWVSTPLSILCETFSAHCTVLGFRYSVTLMTLHEFFNDRMCTHSFSPKTCGAISSFLSSPTETVYQSPAPQIRGNNLSIPTCPTPKASKVTPPEQTGSRIRNQSVIGQVGPWLINRL